MDCRQKRSKVFYGWYIVGACLFMRLYTSGIVNFGFTAVFEPIAEQFGWSYAQISLAGSIRGLEIGLLAPVMGLLVDRWGSRRLVVAGTLILSVGFLIFSRVSSPAMFYGAFVVISIGMSTFGQTVLTSAVANWFRKKVGVAVGIAVSGIGFGGLLVPAVTKLIDLVGWRMAMLTIGLSIPITILPLSLLLRNKPEYYGYQPDGELSSTGETKNVQILKSNTEVNVSAKQALRNRAFWHIAIASMGHSFVVGAVTMHVMPYLSSVGITRNVSSLVALALPLVSVCGRLGGGWLSDRLNKRYVFATSLALIAVGLFFFEHITLGTKWLFAAFIITFSFGWGCSVTTRIALLREHFGRYSFGIILGFMSGIMMVGNISGAPLAGWAFDTWGSYHGVWLCYSALATAGVVLAITIPSSSSSTQLSGQLKNQ